MENGVRVGKRWMCVSAAFEWEAGSGTFDNAASNIAHELGHHLLLKEHYGTITVAGQGIRVNLVEPWSVMGVFRSPPTHPLGWSKYERTWLRNNMENRDRVLTLGPPMGNSINQVVNLQPQEVLRPSGVQLILVRFTADPSTTNPPFQGYIIENRRRLQGDDGITKEGVLVSLVDETQWTIVRCLVMANPRFPGNFDQAPLEVSDSFRDEQRNITISVVGASLDTYQVRVQYPLPSNRRPNPMILPWRPPPWETIDIWIDSERNGWGNYKYVDASGNPEGNGDVPWLDHDNRVYVRIRNLGPGDATNVNVQVYVSRPPGIGVTGNWEAIGIILYPYIRAEGIAEDYFVWRPTTSGHTCIKAEIQRSPDDVDPSNNIAQENIAVFETTRMSPWQPANVQAQVHNPYSKPLFVYFDVRDIPEDWTVELDSSKLEIAPDQTSTVNLTIYPAGLPNEEPSDKYKVGFIGKPKLEAYVPFEDTFVPLGGVEAWVHLVEKNTITINSVTIRSESVSVEGIIKPYTEGLYLAVELCGEKDQRHISFTATDGDGHYVAEFKRPSVGLWTAQAFFDGNSTFSSCGSNEYEFKILEGYAE
jgi:hypothetical protein